jgi:hypothetical protein
MTPNQSLERTLSATAFRFADRQWWRAAQLQIRQASMQQVLEFHSLGN